MATKGEDRIDPELLRELGRTEEELNREFEEARKRGEERARTEPRAVAARYDAATRRIAIDLQNGSTFICPVELGQGIADSSDEDLAKVEVILHGYALHWETLDADLAVPRLLAGVFGGPRWMAELGRSGGQKTSQAKAAAARENGKRGGRPRKNSKAS